MSWWAIPSRAEMVDDASVCVGAGATGGASRCLDYGEGRSVKGGEIYAVKNALLLSDCINVTRWSGHATGYATWCSRGSGPKSASSSLPCGL